MFQTAVLGTEAHDMTFGRHVDGTRKATGIIVADSIDEVTRQTEVASAMAVAGVLSHFHHIGGTPLLSFACEEFRDSEFLHIAFDHPVRAHQAGTAAVKASIENAAVTPLANSIFAT